MLHRLDECALQAQLARRVARANDPVELGLDTHVPLTSSGVVFPNDRPFKRPQGQRILLYMVSYRALLVASLVAALCFVPLAAAGNPTNASWAKAANAICAGENAQVRSLPKVTSQTFVSDLKAIAKYATRTVNRLAMIPRPPAEAKLIASMIATGRSQNKLALAQAIPAAQRGDAATTNRAMARVGKLGDQSNSMARKLGATTCAANPTPTGTS